MLSYILSYYQLCINTSLCIPEYGLGQHSGLKILNSAGSNAVKHTEIRNICLSSSRESNETKLKEECNEIR